MADRGRWLVTAGETTLAFDLRTGVVETQDERTEWHRLRGDRGLRLQSIDLLRVGEPARWWMRRPLDGVRGALHSFVSEPVTAIVSAWSPTEVGAVPGLSYLGPCYTEETMRERLGVEPAALEAMVADLQVLRVTTADGREVYPAFQVTDDGALLPGLAAVLSQLGDGTDDAWTHWLFLMGRPEYACGRQVWELLRDGDIATVVRAASRASWAWRQ